MFRLLLLLLFFNLQLFSKENKVNILILNSFNQVLPWSLEVNKGLEKANQKYQNKINYYVVNFDYLRTKDTLSYKDWENFILAKYQGIKFDGIIVSGNLAYKKITNFSKDFLKEVPRVYNDNVKPLRKTYELELSLDREKTVRETIELAIKLHPNIKNIYGLEGYWEDTHILKKIMPFYLKQNPNLKYIPINNFTFENLPEKIKNINKDSILISTIIGEDSKGVKRRPIDIMKELTLYNKNLPIYSFLNTFLSTDIVGGGAMLNGSTNVQTAIDAIIDYKKYSKFNSKYNDKMKSYIKYEAIKKFNINQNLIPKDVIILNKPKTIFEEYYYESVFILILLFSLLFILVILVFLIYKLKDTNSKLYKETEEKLKKETLLIQQTKSALMGEMLSQIAHQWRQPLNRINSNLAVINIQTAKLSIFDDFIDNSINNIELQTKYMSQTIEDFSQFLSNTKRKEEFNLKKQMFSMLDLIKPRLTNIQYEIDIQENIYISTYKNELSQVLIAILNNAIDAIEKQKIQKPLIKIYSKEDEKKIELFIEDNAKGIDEKIIDKVFDANFSTKNERKVSGIGLYISKNIIENSIKGEIIASNKNNGACFKILIYK